MSNQMREFIQITKECFLEINVQGIGDDNLTNREQADYEKVITMLQSELHKIETMTKLMNNQREAEKLQMTLPEDGDLPF